MKAIVYHADFPAKVALIELDSPQINSTNECLVKLSHVALNRRDQWIREGLYPGIQDHVILGSDGCGTVVEGPARWLNQKVIINPNIDWGNEAEVQSAAYQILGMPINGTLAEYIVVNQDRLQNKPAFLSEASAAALPLAGLTAFRACFTKGQVAAGKKVLITGIGGGVAQFAAQFSVAVEAEVYVTSSQTDKITTASKYGVSGGFDYKEKDWVRKAALAGPFDTIIDSAGGTAVNDYLKLVKPGGKVVFYGSTTGSVPSLNMARLFWSQAQLIGSTMGNDQEFEAMVSFVNHHQILPMIDKVYALDDYIQAFERFKSPDHQGKIVLAI